MRGYWHLIIVALAHEAFPWLAFIEQELVLFAAFWMLVGALDDFSVDALWIWLKLTGRLSEGRIERCEAEAPLRGGAAVMIAAWQEADVIGHTIRHALAVWPHAELTLYIGCYPNDPATIRSAMSGAGLDPRIRIVIHDRTGPTTKADCLNRLYRALNEDEVRYGIRFRSIILHDSEDMVHPAELAVIDTALEKVDFAQLPVRPEPHHHSRWVSGHYLDEFAESHGKALVVRDAVGAAIPAAGVGCGFSREIMSRIASRRLGEGGSGPFAAECLTEDYELGILVQREGGRASFVRTRDETGAWVATRAYFPASLHAAVRQKTRWIHGIAFQAWDRLGWDHGGWDRWMALRDRRGPMTAIVLTSAYVLLVVEGLLALMPDAPTVSAAIRPAILDILLSCCMAAFLWRAAFRFGFTASEYGAAEGVRALLRIPVANAVMILAGRRALAAYLHTLRGRAVRWDKTSHDAHPAAFAASALVHL